MKKFLALLNARNKEFYRDRSTLGWTFIFPFVVILGFAYGYSGRAPDVFKIGVIGDRENADARAFLSTPHVQFVDYTKREEAVEKVRRHQLDLLLELPPSWVQNENQAALYWINSSSAKGEVAERLLQSSWPEPTLLARQEVTGAEVRYVDWLIPGILAMNMMFSSLFGVGYAIVRYRKNGVLKRLRATPVTAFQFLTAQLVSRLLLIQFTSAIVFFGAWALVRFEMRGSLLTLFLFFSLGAMCMISLGLIFAARIASEELAEGLLNLLTWPMMLLSGIWFSLDGASRFVQHLSYVFPLTHVVTGARAIILDGAGFASIVPQTIILGVSAAVFLAIGCAIFRWS